MTFYKYKNTEFQEQKQVKNQLFLKNRKKNMNLSDLRRFVSLFSSQTAAAKAMGIGRGQLNDMLKERQPFGKVMQARLAKAQQELNQGTKQEHKLPFPHHDISNYSIPIYDAFVFAGSPGMVFDAPSNLLPTQGRFIIQVRGDSMKDADIFSGDMLIVQKTPYYSTGDIVVARIGDEFTVKRIKNGNGLTLLNPDNPKYEPIVVDEQTDWECVGIVEYLVRKPVKK